MPPDPKEIADLKKHTDAFDHADAEEGVTDPGDDLVEDDADDGDTTEPGIDDPDLDDDEGAYGIAAE